MVVCCTPFSCLLSPVSCLLSLSLQGPGCISFPYVVPSKIELTLRTATNLTMRIELQFVQKMGFYAELNRAKPYLYAAFAVIGMFVFVGTYMSRRKADSESTKNLSELGRRAGICLCCRCCRCCRDTDRTVAQRVVASHMESLLSEEVGGRGHSESDECHGDVPVTNQVHSRLLSPSTSTTLDESTFHRSVSMRMDGIVVTPASAFKTSITVTRSLMLLLRTFFEASFAQVQTARLRFRQFCCPL